MGGRGDTVLEQPLDAPPLHTQRPVELGSNLLLDVRHHVRPAPHLAGWTYDPRADPVVLRSVKADPGLGPGLTRTS